MRVPPDAWVLDSDGNPKRPSSLEEWAEQLASSERRIYEQVQVGEHSVSTVFLCTDHSFGDGPPVLFETMVFPECEDMERYYTLEQAAAGHERMVAKYRAKLS